MGFLIPCSILFVVVPYYVCAAKDVSSIARPNQYRIQALPWILEDSVTFCGF